VAVKSWLERPLIAWAILFGLLVLAPTSTVFVLPDFIYEHRMYLSLAAASLLSALVLERVLRRAFGDTPLARQVFAGLGLAAVVALGVTTWERNKVWLDEVTLWGDAIAKAPNKPRPKTNLGLYYQDHEPYKITLLDGRVLLGDVMDGDKVTP